jgi:hypothetical protein
MPLGETPPTTRSGSFYIVLTHEASGWRLEGGMSRADGLEPEETEAVAQTMVDELQALVPLGWTVYAQEIMNVDPRVLEPTP